MDSADFSALVGIFDEAIQIVDDVAPVLSSGIDGATAGAIGRFVSTRLGELRVRLEHIPSIDGIPRTVFSQLAKSTMTGFRYAQSSSY